MSGGREGLAYCDFFFQAEDGIRDLVRSRGLGDVYKRQPLHLFDVRESLDRELQVNTYWHSQTVLLLKRGNRYFPIIEPILKEKGIPDDFKYLAVAESALTPVSYTHLTLPTIYSV